MKKVEVVPAREVEVKPLNLKAFTAKSKTKETEKYIGKREIREWAEALDLTYDEEKIVFAKKIMNAYMKKEK